MMFSPRVFYQSAVCMENDFAAFESVLQSGCGDLAGAVLRRGAQVVMVAVRRGLRWAPWFVAVGVPP